MMKFLFVLSLVSLVNNFFLQGPPPQAQTQSIGVFKQVNLDANTHYFGGVDLFNEDQKPLYVKIFDPDSIMLVRDSIAGFVTDSLRFDFISTTSGIYTMVIGFEHPGNRSFQMDNVFLKNQVEVTVCETTEYDAYRYGFQEQEKDDEIKGAGNSVNYKHRMEDPRLGRFFAVDPLVKKFPFWAPYAFSANMPIQFRELEGLEIGVDNRMEKIIVQQTFPDNEQAQKEMYNTYLDATGNAGIIGITFGVGYFGVAIMGVEAFTAWLIEEGIEFTIEEATGVPIINDPWDVAEGVFKRIWKKGAKEAGEKAGKEVVEKSTKGVTKDSPVDEITESATKKIDDTVEDVASGTKNNPYMGQSKDDLLKSKESYEGLIKEHKAKIEEFKKDPIGNSSPDALKTMTKDNPSQEILMERAKGRISALEKQLNKQIGELNKINEALKAVGN